jgi:hypothetical protein
MVSFKNRTTTGSLFVIVISVLMAMIVCAGLPGDGVARESQSKPYTFFGDGDDVGGYKGGEVEDSPIDGIERPQSVLNQRIDEIVSNQLGYGSTIWCGPLSVVVWK